MKILMASHYFDSHKGGIEAVAKELFGGFAARGQEVIWMASVATPPLATDATKNTRTVALPVFNFVEDRIGLPFPIPTLGALSKIRREVSNADVLILHDCLYLSNILAYLIAWFSRVPTIVIQHVGFIPYSSRVLNAGMRIANATITRPMLARAAQVVFISEITRKSFPHLRYRRPPEIVFNGVNTEIYRGLTATETRTELCRQHDLPDNCPIVLFVGRFVEKKGLLAMRQMVELRPDWIWVFAGWGPLDPRHWNVPNIRVFSNLNGHSMAALYRACNLLVLPSVGEGFPLVVQEALATGLPVVCGAETLEADPSLMRFVRGANIHAGDHERTARDFLLVIDGVLRSDMATQSKSAERQAFAVARYSWNQTIERYLEILSRVTPSSNSHPVEGESMSGTACQ